MDYYKEDSSNKNSLIDEAKANNNLLYNPNKTEKSDVTYQLDKINNDKKSNISKIKRKRGRKKRRKRRRKRKFRIGKRRK